MVALAAGSSWTAQDDVKLKNSVEAGVSLESLAKGVLQFSRRFTVQELQDRWRALLYDPIVSAEASARMLEFEHSALAPTLKSNQLDIIQENIPVSGKRKGESVRRRFYAMRKRMRDQQLISLDLGFPNATVNINSIRKEEHCPVADFLICEPVQNGGPSGFPNSQAACHAGISVDVIGHTQVGLNNGIGDNNLAKPNVVGSMVSDAYQHSTSIVDADALVEDLDDFKEIYDLLEDEETELPSITDQIYTDNRNEYSGFGGGQAVHLPGAFCEPAIQNSGSSATLPEMAVWNTNEGPCSSTFPRNHVKDGQHDVQGTFDLPGNDHAAADNGGNQISCNDNKSTVPNADSYLIELSNTLFDFTVEEDLSLMDADGNLIDKSYIDGFSSLLLESPGRDTTCNITVSTTTVADEYVNKIDACLGESGNKTQHQCVHQEIHNSEGLLLSSASGMISKPCNLEAVCTFNTEDPEIPSNDDVFLLPLAPLSSLPFVLQQNIIEPPPHSTSKCVKDSSNSWKKDHGFPRQRIRKSNRIDECQFSSPIIGSQLRSEMLGDSRINLDLPKGKGEHEACRNSRQPYGEQSHVHGETICGRNPFPGTIAAVAKKSEQPKHHCNAEIGLADTTIPNLVIRRTDEEEFPSDDDIPNFSDVEAMILDVDMSPDDRLCLNEAESHHHLPSLYYEHGDFQKRIIRAERTADACVRRDMTSRGAFAILQGRRIKYYIKKPEVLLGRATEDVHVDIDLGKEGRCSRVSRRQAIIDMDQEGSFHIKNLSRHSIFVNSVELATDKSISLTSNCLIEIRGMPFLFETNQRCIKQYVSSINKTS